MKTTNYFLVTIVSMGILMWVIFCAFMYHTGRGFIMDGLMLGFLPGSIIYSWYEYKQEWKTETKYITLSITAVTVIFCLVRAIITGGFASSYYGKLDNGEYISPYGVWKFAAILGIAFGVAILLHVRNLLKPWWLGDL